MRLLGGGSVWSLVYELAGGPIPRVSLVLASKMEPRLIPNKKQRVCRLESPVRRIRVS